MAEYDWSKFKLRINIKTYGHLVYDMWARPENIERWFLSRAEFTMPDGQPRSKDTYIQAGDVYAWNWFGHPDTTTERGKVLEMVDKKLIKFTFAGECIVTVSIKVEDGEVIVELAQENIPLDEKSKVGFHLGCSNGWTFYLANLKSVLECGHDLRNRNLNLKQMVNA